MAAKVLIETDGLTKKFSTGLRNGMLHGLRDWLGSISGLGDATADLRTGEFFAVRKVNFRLHEGEILAVVGMNGSGKTSLMRLLSGIYLPDDGSTTYEPGLRITAIFALNAGLQPLFTGWENIYLKGALYGMSRADIQRKLPFIESFSELGESLDRPVGNYSSGMRARLSYSIAMATDPDVFIIDESLAVGDSAFKAKCFDNLREFTARPGKGVIFVTNHIRKVLKLADRLLVMERGRIIHETEDIRSGLEFYIRSCYSQFGPHGQAERLKKIREYEM